MTDIFTMPAVVKQGNHENLMHTVPTNTVKGMYVRLDRLSFAESAKYGEVGRWPSTHLFRQHFPSFLDNGYEGHREPLDVKFDLGGEHAHGEILPFSIGYIDGQNKAIIMLSVMALLKELAT